MPNRNLLVKLTFVGTNYHGFQIQRNAVTVQEVFQCALRGALGGELPDIKGCSRTDAGVHAKEFFLNFLTDSAIDNRELTGALNFYLPKDIRVVSVSEVAAGFHARYSCRAKRYRYVVINSRVMDPFLEGLAFRFTPYIDEKKLDNAARRFIGTRDFYPFSGYKRVSGSTVRTVSDFSVTRQEQTVSFLVTADGFLYNMARVMVGTLLSVAAGNMDADEITGLFDSKKRGIHCYTAPAGGLYLDKVFYDPEAFHENT